MQRRDRDTAALVKRALRLSGRDVQTQARRKIRTGKRTGNKYVRYKPRRTGTAGRQWQEPPKTDEGILIGSIFWEPKQPVDHVLVGTRLDYGKHLENNGWKWLAPSLNDMRERINERFRNAMKGLR